MYKHRSPLACDEEQHMQTLQGCHCHPMLDWCGQLVRVESWGAEPGSGSSHFKEMIGGTMTPMFDLFVSVSLDSQQFLLPFFGSVSDTAEPRCFQKRVYMLLKALRAMVITKWPSGYGSNSPKMDGLWWFNTQMFQNAENIKKNAPPIHFWLHSSSALCTPSSRAKLQRMWHRTWSPVKKIWCFNLYIYIS